jgi:two-component system, sensor histidine kinase
MDTTPSTTPPLLARLGLAPDPRGGQRADETNAALVAFLFRNMPAALGTHLLVPVLVAIVLRDAVPLAVLVPWLAFTLVQVPVRGLVWHRYRQRERTPAEAHRWVRFATMGTTWAGIAWGIGGIALFVPERLDFQLLLLAVQIGLAMGAVFSGGSHLATVFTYFYPATVPFCIRLFAEGDPLHFALGAMCVLFIVAVSWLALGFQRTLRESVVLRFENLELVQELRLQKDAAEQANRAKSSFLAAASHDLRQPLQALTLFNETLRRRDLPAPERAIVEDMTASIGALDGLFNALLDISRLDAGVVTPNIVTFPLAPLFQRIATEFGPAATAKGLRLSAALTRRYVVSDPILLERILRNLVANSVRYTPSGGVVFGCRWRGDGQVRIEVRDTGIGIPADQHAAVFGEFYQLGNPQRDRTQGLGLGLAIVDRLTKLLGHGLRLRSELGRGTTFTLELPAGLARDHRPVVEDRTDAVHLDGVLALVIDDEPHILRGMQMLLESWHCQALIAPSLEAFLAENATRGAVPDIILSDYRLADGRSGVEAIAALREEFNREIPAMVISGDIAADRLREAQAAGLTLMHKPIEPDRLLAAMTALLRRG